jgi:hypothetical protein
MPIIQNETYIQDDKIQGSKNEMIDEAKIKQRDTSIK